MNWYKQAQLKEKWNWGNFVLVFGLSVISGLLGLKQIGMLDLQKAFADNPQQVVQEAEQVQQQQQIEPPPGLAKIEPPTGPVEVEESPKIEEAPEVEEAPKVESANIDINKIWGIESSKGTAPNMGKSKAGARGHFQFMKNTWNDIVGQMGKKWDWKNGSMDYKKSKQVAEYYLNTKIPYMLNYYKIPDTIETRLTAYDWGIGSLRQTWKKHGKNWKNAIPTETKDYFVKYKGV